MADLVQTLFPNGDIFKIGKDFSEKQVREESGCQQSSWAEATPSGERIKHLACPLSFHVNRMISLRQLKNLLLLQLKYKPSCKEGLQDRIAGWQGS